MHKKYWMIKFEKFTIFKPCIKCVIKLTLITLKISICRATVNIIYLVIVVKLVHVSTKTSSCLPWRNFRIAASGDLLVFCWAYTSLFSKPLRKQTYSIRKWTNVSNQNSIFLISHMVPTLQFLHSFFSCDRWWLMCLHYFVN